MHGNARTQRFAYTVKPQNKEQLGNVMTLIIMTVYMEQNQVSFIQRIPQIYRGLSIEENL